MSIWHRELDAILNNAPFKPCCINATISVFFFSVVKKLLSVGWRKGGEGLPEYKDWAQHLKGQGYYSDLLVFPPDQVDFDPGH